MQASPGTNASTGLVQIDVWRGDDARRPTRDLAAEALGVRADELRLVYGPHGKPLVESPAADARFSIARTKNVTIVATASGIELGADVEGVDRDVTQWAMWRHVLTPEETDGLPADGAARGIELLRRWVRREALLKAAGVGLSVDPSSIRLGSGGAVRAIPSPLGSREAWTIRDVDIGSCVAAVACRHPAISVMLTEKTEGSTTIRDRT